VTLNILDLFSGIGGFTYAAERICPSGAFRTVQFVENNEYCQHILKQNYPDVPVFGDIRQFAGEYADVVTMGFPCQDLSSAGNGVGLQGSRSGLFYVGLEIIRRIRPKYVVLENTASAVKRALPQILGELSKAGYDAEWACLWASDLGACHKRSRLYLLAYANGSGSKRESGGFLDRHKWSKKSIGRIPGDYRKYISKPAFYRGDDGLSDRLHSADKLLQSAETKEDIGKAGKSIRKLLHELRYREDAISASQQGIRLQPFKLSNLVHNMPRESSFDSPNRERERIRKRLRDVWSLLCGEIFKDYENMLQELLERARQVEHSEKMGTYFYQDRLKALGNSVVPQCAAVPLMRILQLEAKA
jgi:DNA-cytosine methyltransferase